MSDAFKALLASGKKLLTDTKQRTKVQPEGGKGKLPTPAAGSSPETDPHKVLQKRAIKEKLKKKEIVESVQKICDAEDAKL